VLKDELLRLREAEQSALDPEAVKQLKATNRELDLKLQKEMKVNADHRKAIKMLKR